MKKNVIYFFIFLVLAVIAVYLYFRQSSGTLQKELHDFAVEDTATISKIFMVDKSNQRVTLSRKDNAWMVNGKFQARTDAMNNLLVTIRRLDVKYPVAKAAMETVIKNLAGESIKVEIYAGEKLLKTYYVGGPTQDHTGTYMLLEGSNVPFIMTIPGFNGYLTLRYILDEILWQQNVVFYNKFKEIKSVKVQYFEKPENSFTACQLGENKFGLKAYDGREITVFDTLLVKQFLAEFKLINYEAHVSMPEKKKDSLLSTPPLFIMTVERITGEKKTLKTFRVLDDKGRYGDDGKPMIFDPDRMYGFMNNDQEIVTVQYFIFDPLCISVNDFILPK